MTFPLIPLGPSDIDPISGLSEKKTKTQTFPITPVGPSIPQGQEFYGDTEVGKGKFDEGILPSEISRIDQIRAGTQTTAGKAFNSIIGGVASGVLTAIEDIGYILDFDNNINRLNGLEAVESNWLSDIMKRGKEGLGKGMPIYRYNQNKVFDWSDPGFYFEAIKGILDSAVGFAIPGMAASKAIGAAQRGMRLNKYLEMMKASPRVEQMINAGLSGYITNFGEGKMMAIEQYETSLERYKEQLLEENYNTLVENNPEINRNALYQMAQENTQRMLDEGAMDEFRKTAGIEANEFMNRNKMFALTDAIGLHGLYKGKNFTRNVLKGKNLSAKARSITSLSSDNLLLQAAKEGAEEIGQNILQMEGEYQTLKGLGAETDSPEDLALRVYEFATSDKALLEGMMGLLGGGPQRILTETLSGVNRKKSRAEYKRRYEEQQSLIQQNKDFLNKKLGFYAQAQFLRSEAIRNGEDNLEEIIKKSEFVVLAADNLEKGTTGELERLLKDIVNMTPEQAQENGFEEDYQTQAQDQLNLLRDMEKSYLRYSRYENQRDVFDNRMNRKILEEERVNLRERIDELETELELQEIKDPDTERVLKGQKNRLEQVSRLIAERDKEYKHLISFETQKGVRQKRKDQAKQQRVNEEKIKNKVKQEKAEEKAESRKRRTEKKVQEEEAKKTEKERATTAEEEADVNPLIDDVNIETGDESSQFSKEEEEIDIPAEDTDLIAKQEEGKTTFNDRGNELLNDLESGALVTDDQGKTRNENRVRLFEEMVEGYKDSVGKDEIDFAELVEALIDRFGSNRIEPIFKQIEAIYSLTPEGKDYIPTSDLAEYRKLTPDEKKERDAGRRATKRAVVGQYTSLDEQEYDKNISSLEQDIRKNDKKQRAGKDIIVDYLRVNWGHNIIAYLSRQYEQSMKNGILSKEEITDDVNEDIQDINILDRNKYGEGTEVTLKLEDRETTPAYIEGDFTKRKTNWGTKKADKTIQLDKLVKDGTITREEADRRYQSFYEQQVPIAIYVGDQKIGYLHETEWINETNVNPDNVKQDKEYNHAVRQEIIAKREYKTTIIHRSDGYLPRSSEGHHDVSDAIKNPEIPIVVASQGQYKSNRNKTENFENLLNKKDPKEGRTHIVVPVGKDKQVAIPLAQKRVDEAQDVANSITTALEIFLLEKEDEKSKAIVDAIFEATGRKDPNSGEVTGGILITTKEGITDYIEMFINNLDIGGSSNLEKYLETNGDNRLGSDVFVKMFRNKSRDDISFQISRGNRVSYTWMTRKRAKEQPDKLKDFFDAVIRELPKMYTATSLDHLGANKNAVLIGADGQVYSKTYEEHVKSVTTTPFLEINIGTEENPNYIYTIQPVIELDFNEITAQSVNEQLAEEPKNEKTEADEVPTVEKPKEDQKMSPNRKGYSRGRKLNLDNLESGAYTKEDENELFKRLVKEWNDPNTTPKRKAELDEVIASMYYADGEMISVEEKRNIARRKLGKPDLEEESGAILALDEDQMKAMLNAVEARIEDKRVKGVIIRDLGPAKQKQIVDFIRAEIVRNVLVENKKEKSQILSEIKGEFDEDLKTAQENLKTGEVEKNQPLIKESEVMIADMVAIDKNWQLLVEMVEQQLTRIDSIKKVGKENIAEKEEDEINQEQNESDNWGDSTTYTNDPSDGLAWQLKRFFSGIGAYRLDENGKIVPDRNFLNDQKTMSYQEVYEAVQRLTPNLKPNFKDLLGTLEEIAGDPKRLRTYPFLTEVVEKLRKAPEQVKNQFVSGMTNHEVNMRFIMVSRNRDGGIQLVEHRSNSNEMTRVILSQWKGNFIAGSTVRPLEDTGEYVIDKAVAETMTSVYKKWEENKEFPPEEVRQYLEDSGIFLSDQTFDDLMNGKIKGGTGKNQRSLTQHLNKGGLLRSINDSISSLGNAPLETSKTFLDESVVERLARVESEYALYSHSNSHRTGNRTVYSYSLNKFLINRVRELTDFNEDGINDLLERLADMEFNGHSGWVQLARDEKTRAAFIDNFDRWVFSLEPIKRKGSKPKDNKELHKLSEKDIEVAKIGMVQGSHKDMTGDRNRVIQILYPTTSDKTTVMGLRVLAANLSLTKEGRISKESVDLVFDKLVRPEISRIQAIQRGDINNIDSYEKGGQQFLFLPEINTIEDVFINGELNKDILGDTLKGRIKEKVEEYVNNLVDEKIKFWTENEIIGGKDVYLNSEFMSATVASKDGTIVRKNPLIGVESKHKTTGAATDMVFQYLIGNAEIAMTMNGDPALYFKQGASNKKNKRVRTDEDYDFIADAKETYINIGKRLAADIAPGYEIAQDAEETYRQGFLIDPKTVSERALEITALLDGKEAHDKAAKDVAAYQAGNISQRQLADRTKHLNSGKYYNIDSADAQEYTTWREHLRVMLKAGELSKREYDEAYRAFRDKTPIDKERFKKVLQPMKPVYVDSMDSNGVERRVYIKSSSFPLIPQLTAGLDLDNLREAMESQGVDRVAYGTAVKVGNITEENQLNVYNDQGHILPANQISFENSTLDLRRKGFRIQQKVPYKSDKAEIRKVTQASKNLFVNMLNVEGFMYDGKPYTGKELQDIYHDLYNKLHKIQYDQLIKDVTINNDPDNLDINKLKDILLKEAGDRNYPILDQELLNIDEHLKFLSLSPSANKYESLLNSIVTARVIRLTLPGKSYVLGSEEGFQTKLTENEAEKKLQQEGIVFTSHFKDKLKPAREVNGRIQPAQAIVPWKFRDKEGKIINMEEYVVEKDGKKFIDMERVDKKAFQMFGMRIPNQGPNSQSIIEIVGFLPEESGDLLIATKDYVVQMGSDFDVDKLYTYMYNLYEADGRIQIHKKGRSTQDRIRALQNSILDVHLAIHKNTSPVVQSQIANPLGFWKLQEFAEEIVELREERQAVEEIDGPKKMFTGLSDDYQREKFKNAAAGKSGVGVFSLDSMFNSVAQGKGLLLTANDQPVTITLGKEVSKGELSNEYALDEKTYISDVIAGYQSAAVDNEKEQILDKLNINTHTFKVIKLLNQLGFTDVVPLLTAQDIIIDYVKELERLTAVTSGYQPNAQDTAKTNVLSMSKYQLREGEENDYDLAGKKATPAALRDYISKGEAAPNYRAAQRAILNQFLFFDELGQQIQMLQSATNIDSKGVGKSLLESLIKEEQVMKLPESNILNAEKLIGDFVQIGQEQREEYENDGYIIKNRNNILFAIKPETINGQAIIHGLFINNHLWSHLFNYDDSGVKAVMEKLEFIAKGDNETSIERKADRRKDIWNDIKSFVYSEDKLKLHDTTVTTERVRLLYDQFVSEEVVDGQQVVTRRRQTYKSLASIVKDVGNTQFGRRNSFIARLEPVIQKNGTASLVTFRASAAEHTDETYLYVDIIRMLEDNTTVLGTFNGEEYTPQRLMQELILYSYITGGLQEAVQFVKYIPAAYLTSIPFANAVSGRYFDEEYFGVVKTGNIVKDLYETPPFVEQRIQHHPETVPQLEESEISSKNYKNIQNATAFTITKEGKGRTGKVLYVGEEEGFKTFHAPYVTIRGGNSDTKLRLFKYNPRSIKNEENQTVIKAGTYTEIDTLGVFGASEYNANVEIQVSLNRYNKSRVPVKDQPKNPGPTSYIADDVEQLEEKDNTFADIVTKKTKTGRIYSGKNSAKKILVEVIEADGDPYLSALAGELVKATDQFSPAITFRVENKSPNGYAGKYSYKAKEITLYNDVIQNNYYANRIMVHEMLHALVGYKVMYYEEVIKNKSKDKDLAEGIVNLTKSIPGFEFTERDEKIMKSLTVLLNQAEKAIANTPELKEQLKEMRKSIAERKPLSDSDKQAAGKLYGLTSLSEFVTMALTDYEFQTLLNNVEAPSGKTFWQILKERLVKLLKEIGLDIREGSVLEHTVYDVLDLVTTKKAKDEANTEKKVEGKPPPVDDGFDVSADIDPIDLSLGPRPNMTTVKKAIGLTSKVYSDRRKNMILKRLGQYNKTHDSSHSLTFKEITPTSYEIDTFTLNYNRRDEEAKRQRDFERDEDNITAVEEVMQKTEEAREEYLTAGEREEDLGRFTDEGDFIPPSYFPGPATRRVTPKFQEYIKVKEEEKKDQQRRLAVLEKKKDKEKSRQIRKKLFAQIERINKKIEDIDAQIEDIMKMNNLHQISIYAEEDMQVLDRIFKKKNPSGKDLDLAEKIIHIWQQAADFSGNTPHVFYDEEEIKGASTVLKDITAKFKEWGERADEYNLQLIDAQEKYMNKNLEGLFGKTVNFKEPIRDVNFLVKNLLDITEVDNLMFQGIGKMVKDANFAAKLEYEKHFEEIDRLIKKSGLRDFSIFQQTFSNDDEKLTGELVYRFTQSYYDWHKQLKDTRTFEMERASQEDVLEKANNMRYLANKKFVEELRKSVEMFDTRILFGEDETKKEKLKDKLRNLLGEKGFSEHMELAEKRYKEYQEDLEDYITQLEAEIGDNQAMVEDQKNSWIAKNSPDLFAEQMEKGYDAVSYNKKHPYPSNRYVVYIPAELDNEGNQTNFYDQKFKNIEENENYLELYNYIYNLLQELKSYLPYERVKFMQINSIPFLKKKVLEQMTGGGVAESFSKSKELILDAVRMDDIADVQDTEGRRQLQIQMISNNKKRINAYVNMKDTEYRAEGGNLEELPDKRLEWRKEITDLIARQEKSFDLGRIMKAFAATAITYKHKSSMEDMMRIAQSILQRTQEEDKYGNVLSTKNLRNIKDMFDNFLEVAYWGYASNRPEGKGKKKVLSEKEKELEQLLLKSKEELDQLLADNKITNREYTNRLEVVNDQLETLGGVKVVSKYGDILLKYIQYKGMGWNVFAAFANMGFGFLSNVIEASDGRNYSMKSFRKAQVLVLNSLGRNITFNRLTTANAKKIRILMDRFDVLKEAKNEIYKPTEEKLFKRIGKRVEWMRPFNTQSRSEYLNQAPIMIAMMMDRKLKMEDGTEVSVWDMYDVDGNIKEGYDFNKEEMFKLKSNIDQVVKMNHGNYDPDKPLAGKRKWIGRAILQFRTWALQGFAERFHTEFEDHNLHDRLTKEGEAYFTRKGRYRSYAAFFTEYNRMMGAGGAFHMTHQLLRKLVGLNTKFDDLVKGEFTEVDAANMRKNMTEIVMYMMLTALILALKYGLEADDDENKAKRLASNFLINQMARVATDIAFYTNPMEFERLFRNAIPAFTFVTDGWKFMDSAWGMITGDEDILQSGPNKGMSRTWRDFQKLIPGPTQAQKIKSASEQIYKKN